MENIRILYVPNETGDFRQLGFRRPLANLLGAGLISEASVFSLQWRIRNGGDSEAHRQDLIAHIRDFKPNVVLMQHLGSTGLTDRHFKAMRSAAQFDLVYHEADPFSRFLHPLPKSAAVAGRFADVVFTVGSGVFSENFRRNGARDVRWAPHVFESERYRISPESRAESRPFDVVIVANRNRPRFRGHPNWKDRIAFVTHMQDRFGERLALYGNGWTGVGAMGSIEPTSQDAAIRTAWVSANWDHYATEPNYFSNRLPISLATGSIHATTRHLGYSELFPAETKGFLLFGDTQRALADEIEGVLESTSTTDRIAEIRKGQEFAHKHYRQDDQMLKFLNFRERRISPLAASAVWDIDSAPLDDL